MKKILGISVLLFSLQLSLYAQCTFESFHKYFPTASILTKTISTTDGGILTIAGGYTRDTAQFSDEDIVVVKLDSCGKILWQFHYGDPSEADLGFDAVETLNGDYMILGDASFHQAIDNIRVLKVSKNGVILWDSLYTGNIESRSNSINRTTDGRSFVITGDLYKAVVNIGICYVPYLLKIDENGVVQKSKYIKQYQLKSGSYYDYFSKCFQTNDTSFLFIEVTNDSVYLLNTDTSFNVRWSKPLFTNFKNSISFNSVACLSYNKKNIALTVRGDTDLAGPKDFLIKFNLDGSVNTTVVLSTDSFIGGYISPTSDNGYIYGGWLTKIDSNLKYMWSSHINNRGSFLNAMQLPNGYYIGSGLGETIDNPGGELYIVKTDKTGNFAVTGIAESAKQEQTELRIYPNPASDMLHIESNSSHTLQMELMSITGQLVYTSSFESSITIHTQSFPQGMYVVRVMDKTTGSIHTYKIVLMK